MAEKKKQTISLSLDKQQIDMIDQMARNQRVKTGENVTRSEIVRYIVDAMLDEHEQQSRPASTPSPASHTTPGGGRSGERSDAAAGGIEKRQGG